MGELVDLTKKADEDDSGAEVVYLNDKGEVLGEKPSTEGHGPRGRVSTPGFGQSEYSEALLKEAAEFIERNEIEDGGGWREDEHRKAFWLRLPRLLEYEKADRRIKDDREFWKWYRKFRNDNAIGQSRGKVNWGSYYNENDYKPKNYLKDWWNGWGWGGGYSNSGSSELTRKLAVAQGAVATTVNVINDTGKRYQVEFADDTNTAPMSATMYDEARIVVSPQALLDAKIDQGEAIEITTGYALHEGSHVQYSEPLVGALKTPTLLEPLRVAALLHNILEDLRIERLTGEKFPGFVDYFVKANGYLWGVQKDKVPKTWGGAQNGIEDKLNSVILMAKWPEQYEPIVKNDPGLTSQWPWWRKWAEQYRQEKAEIRPSIIAALRRLAEDPETKKQMDQMTKQEQDMATQWGVGDPVQLNDKQFKDFLNNLKKQLGDPNSIKPCPSPLGGRPIKLSQKQAAELKKLVKEQFEHFDPAFKFNDRSVGAIPKIQRYRPEEDSDSKRQFKAPRQAIVARMKAAFFFRKTQPVIPDRLQKSGLIDEDELWRVAGNDYRVFQRLVHKETPDTQVTMLVDTSGSMHGPLLATAQELATIMIECLRLMPGIRSRVRGHTNAGANDALIGRIWEPGDPISRLGLLQTMDHGVNWDGYAIDACAQELLDNQRPGEDMVLIVLSDGRPNGGSGYYSGVPAMNHVRAVNTHYARKGVTIIQVAVSGGIRAEDQARMYDNWIPFETAEKLPQQLTQLLIKLFGAE